MGKKYALIIGNTQYADPRLAQLTAPGKDVEDFAHVLRDENICAFDDVKVLLNQPEHIVRKAIEEYFDQKKPDDLIVLYFSGHGIRDELGVLYLAVKNTVRTRLRSTAIKSDFVREVMDQCRSKRQVLILDCCNSGAFAQGTKAAFDAPMGAASAFEAGYGRVILTASDSTQFAWEGDKVIGNTNNSLFTHFLVEGLEGQADLDSDGYITVDELYDYAYGKVRLATPKQTPSKFSSREQGEIILRERIPVKDIRPAQLPSDLVDEIEDTRPYVREAAVQKLEKIIKGKNIGLAYTARVALEKIIEDENTTRRVAQAATQILNSVHVPEQTMKEEAKAKEASETLTPSSTSYEHSTLEAAQPQRLANQRLQKLPPIVAKVELEPFARKKDPNKQLIQHSAKAENASTNERIHVKPIFTLSILSRIGIFGIVVILLFGCGYAVLKFIPAMSGRPTITPTTPAEIPITITFTATMTATPEPTSVPTGTPVQKVAVSPSTIITGNIGTSVLGKSIDFTRMGNGSQILVIAAALHGDEPNAAFLVDDLTENIENSIEAIQDDVTLYFLPRLNPDGLENRSRYNANGVDLNRNWDSNNWRQDAEGPSGRITGSGGSSPFSEPETLALSKLLLELNQQSADPLIVLIYHSAFPPTGLIQPGYRLENQNQLTDTAASSLAQIYANYIGYRYSPTWTGYSITGEAIHWCAEHGISCIDIELPNRNTLSSIEVQNHMFAIMELIQNR